MRSFVSRMVAAMATLAAGLGAASGGDVWTAAPQPNLAAALAAAPALMTTDVCTPVRTIRPGMLYWAPNPDGKTYDLVQVYFKEYGGPNTIVIIDLATGAVKQVQVPRDPQRYNFHLGPAVWAPNGKLYVSILVRGLKQRLCVYDPATNELTLDGVLLPEDVLGETHPLVLGTDGKLYAIGQHAGSKAATAAQIDPATGKVTPYGAIGPSHAPADCWGYSGAADDRYVYIASGKVPWYLVAYDRETGKSETLVTTEAVGGDVSVSQGAEGCTARAVKVVGTDGAAINYWLYEGKAVVKLDAKEAPP